MKKPGFLHFLAQTKLFWGLAVLYGLGVLLSPVNRKGVNIFLSAGNQSDVLRQVSINGIIAVGMTLVILTGGIDLSVGSLLSLGTMYAAMLLTLQGWTSASTTAIPLLAIVCVVAGTYLVPLASQNWSPDKLKASATAPLSVRIAGVVAGFVLACAAVAWTVSQLGSKFGVAAILVTVPAAGLAVGSLTGIIIAKGKLQPFIVTLAMMVAVTGASRLIAGPSAAIYPIYSGQNAPAEVDILREDFFGILPIQGMFFLLLVIIFGFVLKYTSFGRYVYAIGGNEQAARVAGIRVDDVKVTVYALSGGLSALAGILYAVQYRQGKPEAGAGAELDAIAAVVIGGTSLAGGKGSMIGTLVGVLIFGFLGNILILKNIDSNLQLVLKGLIILGAVFLQEGQFGTLLKRLRFNFRSSSVTVPPATSHSK
jgi:simple sugar transport system permease protein